MKENVMNFTHDLLDFDDLPREEINGTRYYKTPDGKLYPSVTTVLGRMSDKSGLVEWRKRVGEEEANRVSTFAATRGMAIHGMCEDYVLGRDIDEMPSNMSMFNQIKIVLDACVNNIRAIECPLMSHHLKLAGTCDLIAEFNGTTSIIDYKTSSRWKKKEWIESYFLQTALYSYMLWEMTGIQAKRIVLIIGVDDSNVAQVFIEDPRHYLPKAVDQVKSYHQRFPHR